MEYTIIPKVSNKDEENGVLKFTLSDVNVSFANAIRRIILSEIPCIVFKTAPYEENKCLIYINTCRLNNEIIKQRLSCIPIHIDDLSFPIEDYIIEVNEKNDTDTIKIITTQDFKIKNIKNGKYLSKEAVHKIFPQDNISNSYIDFVRLRPRVSDDIEGEQIHLECSFIISNAKDDGMFNVVSCAAFGNTVDMLEANRIWNEKEKQLKEEKQSDEEIEYLKKDWYALDALRHFKPNSFDFTIETIGVFENEDIVKKACSIMIEKITKFKQNVLDN
jgi:DNA-directed RNA polymerase II subunit RPB3